MKYCSNCVYPFVSVNLSSHQEVCSACLTAKEFEKIEDSEWELRAEKFQNILKESLKDNTSNYDCVIGVSGGKDSFYQTHIIVKELGLKPLLVTYHGNNYLPEGDYDRDLMRQVFDADHLVFGPSVEILKKLNRLCFRKMGDMNWHAHCGIFTYPIKIAVQEKIPLIIWGETFWDISGMYSASDFVEFTARMRHEHALRGFEWFDLIGDEKDHLTEKDLLWAKYPTDEEILEVGVRGLCIGNYYKWDPNNHAALMKKLYGWREFQSNFQRTYRKISNLDDRYENGLHDYLKFIKFGYGRASDHASKDIRTGYMTRSEGIEMVREYDHVVPDDLFFWLKYVEMPEDEFWSTADTFRDPRVWFIKDGYWHKANIWGASSSYEEVRLDKSLQDKYIR
jgi:N-acetyl sugar amidotransferase